MGGRTHAPGAMWTGSNAADQAPRAGLFSQPASSRCGEPRRRKWGQASSRSPASRAAPTRSVCGLGAPQASFRPSGSRPAHGSVAQWGRSPAPPAESGRATRGTTAVQAEAHCRANGTTERRSARGLPARWPRRARSAGGGAVLRGDTGVQPVRWRVAPATIEPPGRPSNGGR